MESLERRDLLAVLDLTGAATQGTFNDAIFTRADISGSGAGNLIAFVSIQNNGTEQGYNSSFRPVQFNESNSPQQNQDLPLSSVPTVVIDGTVYREFVLDTNEIAGDSRFISLNKVEIYLSAAGGLTNYPFGPEATKIYDMDAGTAGIDTAAPSPDGNWVLIDNQLGPGGGNANMYLLVPNALFVGGSFVTVYSQFGVTAASDNGPEEWGVRTFSGGISGRKFHDLDGNGNDNGGTDPGLPGWTIYLDANNNGQLDPGEVSTTTAADGTYSFGNLAPGTHIVREVLQSGWNQTFPAAGFHSVIVGASTIGNIDFGNVQTLSISGHKFEDLNGNGIRDLGEPGIEGVTITLDIGADGTVNATTTTDATGAYVFADLMPGTYRVREEVPAGFVQTTPDPDDIVLVGANVSGIDFGNFQLITISGQKFDDLDGDGIKDPGEPGIEGVTIRLDRGPDGTIDAETTTDSDGNYSFTGLGPGVYRVREVVPAGRVQTTPNPADIVAISGTNVTDIDFGNMLTEIFASISGQKFEDLNGNGIKDPGEPGIEGVTITLDLDADGIIDAQATTDANGNYAFTGLAAGLYRLREEVPAGYVQTTTDPDDIVLAGEDVTDIDFGNFQLITISGQKFDDINGNGVKDPGEPGIEGVTITLDVGADGTIDAQTTTDADGNYAFTELGPGVYRVREISPPGRIQTTPNPADIVAVSGTDVTDIDFGNRIDIIVVPPDKSNGSLPYVHLVNAATGEVVRKIQAYDLSYRGGVRVATGDLDGDGIAEIIVAPGRNHAPIVKIFDLQGNFLRQIMAYPASFKGGVDIAVGDVNGDGKNDIITAMSYGGNTVKVFRNTSGPVPIPYPNLTFQVVSTFQPFGAKFKGGATVAVADMGTPQTVKKKKTLNSNAFDGKAEIIVGNEAGMRSTVKVYTYFGTSNVATLVRTFLPFDAKFRGGLSLEVARVNADLVPDIIVGAGNGGKSQVQILNGANPKLTIRKFNAFTQAQTPSFNAPLRMAAVDSNGDGKADTLWVVQGTDGTTREIRKFNPLSGALVDTLFETDPDFAGAYFIAGLVNQPTS